MKSANLLEVGFSVALGRARALDTYYAEHGKPVGPLHGVPIMLKDQFHVKGIETCFAYVGWIGTFEGERGAGKERVFQSELVEELVGLGAVVIGKVSNLAGRNECSNRDVSHLSLQQHGHPKPTTTSLDTSSTHGTSSYPLVAIPAAKDQCKLYEAVRWVWVQILVAR